MNKNSKAKHSRPALKEGNPVPNDFTLTLTQQGFQVSHPIPIDSLINLLFSAISALAKDHHELYQPVATACDNLLAYCFPEEVFPTREELLAQLQAEDQILKERVANGEGGDIDFVAWRERQLNKIQELHEAQAKADDLMEDDLK